VLRSEAAATDDPARALDALLEGLALWVGPAAAGVSAEARGHPLFAALDRERLAATAEAVERALRAGAPGRVLPRLRDAVEAAPYDESLQAALVDVLVAAGRRAEGLAVFRAVRQRLVDELGVEPGPELAAAHDRALRPSSPPSSPSPSPPAGPGPRPAQLPRDLSTFTGRRDALSRVAALRSETVLITAVDGMAGVGKTAFAVHWAHQVAGRYPDGQLYVNLRGFDPTGSVVRPADVLRSFLEALGTPAAAVPTDPEARAALYRSLLAGRRVLVLLDNARDADQVRPLLPGTAGCLVLVTSRTTLTGLVAVDGAHPVSLDVLGAQEARDMLARRLGAGRLDAEPAATEEIVAACAGLPLALAVVAARAATRPGYDLASVAADLRDARRRLDALTGTDLASDARSVFSWSYRELTPAAARAFRLLALHTGREISRAAAGSILGAPAGPALAELTRANLLTEPVPGRFVFHDLVLAYATELAAAHDTLADRRAALGRQLDHHLGSAYAALRSAGPPRGSIELLPAAPGVEVVEHADPAAALDWLAAERDSIMLAVRRAAEDEFPGHAWQLSFSVLHYVDRRHDWADWVALQQVVLAAVERTDDLLGAAYTRRGLGLAHWSLAQYDEARVQADEALDLAGRAGDQRLALSALMLLGMTADLTGDFAGAVRAGTRTLELARAGADASVEAMALNNLGYVHARHGRGAEGVEFCRQALTLHLDRGDRHGEASVRQVFAYALGEAGRTDEAVAEYGRAVGCFQGLGDPVKEAEVRAELGDLHQSAGQPRLAGEQWTRALAILSPLDHPDAARIRAKLSE
jgi:tetratricopeptide (TPR) repeat protein